MPQPYAIGLQTQSNEIRLDSLPIRGTIPAWLRGTLLRNGPGQFEGGVGDGQALRHWFDGAAQVHKFAFADGQVRYANKFLRSKSYHALRDTGKVSYQEFASDPCRGLFGRFMSFFLNQPTDNTNVNITLLAGQVVAITELPMALAFDPDTLETLEHVAFADDLQGVTNTPHPHFDFNHQQAINETTRFGRKNFYQLYSVDAKSSTRRLISAVPTRAPAYMHSFAITEQYIVLVEFSLFPNMLKLLAGSTFADSLEFKPNVPSRFIIVRKRDGQIVRTLEAEPFFAFHHVNAYEEADSIVLDIAAFANADIVRALFLDAMRDHTPEIGYLRRYRLPLAGGHADYEQITNTRIELPRIDYEAHNGKPYRYVYGIGADHAAGFMNQLVKIDTVTRQALVWGSPGCHPGEPVYVPHPEMPGEDAGVVLSVVLDTHSANSYLLVLDAATLSEIGRAIVPQVVPLGFHGLYLGGR